MAFLSRLLEVAAMCAAARSSVSRHGPWRVFPSENTGLSQVVKAERDEAERDAVVISDCAVGGLRFPTIPLSTFLAIFKKAKTSNLQNRTRSTRSRAIYRI